MSWENCAHNPCQAVAYAFGGADLDNLTYVYRGPGSSTDEEGTLGPGNGAYRLAWLQSLTLVRLLLPPFTGFVKSCGDHCECQGTETKEQKTYVYTAAFDLESGAHIEITGDFKVDVTTKVGICVPARRTKFVLGPTEYEGASGYISQFLKGAGAPDEEKKHKKQKKSA